MLVSGAGDIKLEGCVVEKTLPCFQNQLSVYTLITSDLCVTFSFYADFLLGTSV